jgi:hypothetical protein
VTIASASRATEHPNQAATASATGPVGVATGKDAVVDRQGRARDPVRAVARVEENRLDVLRLATPAERVEYVTDSRTSCASSGGVNRSYEGVLTSCASSERLISLGRAATARPPAGGAGDPSGDEGRVAHRPRARRPAADGMWCYQRRDRCDDACRQGDGEDPVGTTFAKLGAATEQRQSFAYDHGVVTPGVHAGVTSGISPPTVGAQLGPRDRCATALRWASVARCVESKLTRWQLQRRRQHDRGRMGVARRSYTERMARTDA